MSEEKMPENETGLSFGQAIFLMKTGCLVKRELWKNGRGAFIYIVKGSFCFDGPPTGREKIEGIGGIHFERGGFGSETRLPHFNMRNDRDSIIVGWTPIQADMLAEDWALVPPYPD